MERALSLCKSLLANRGKRDVETECRRRTSKHERVCVKKKERASKKAEKDQEPPVQPANMWWRYTYWLI
jgi:hypothetical protein